MENRPISVILAEARQAIIKTINDTHLDMSIINLIIKDIANDINKLTESQYKSDLIALENNKTVKEDNNDNG